MADLADEPSANLDYESSEKFLELLYGINREVISIVMFTREKEMYGYDQYRRVFFENGRAVKDIVPYSLSLVRREA